MVTRLASGETPNKSRVPTDPVVTVDSAAAFSTEARFLVAAVRRFLDTAAPVPDCGPGDPAVLIKLAIDHAVAPMVYRAARALDSALAKRLRATCDKGALASLRLAAELCTLSDLLARNGIAFVPLKGPLLSQRLYGDVSVRTSGDLDLLVREEDLLAARDVAAGLGYEVAVASKFIAISMPANVPLALGITLSGVLRAVGDARRAMYVTLSAGAATAVLDPLLIFGFGLGVYGAAWATVLSRLIMLGVGWSGAAGVHNLVARPKLGALRGDFGPIMAIGFPAIMANMAAPVSSAYTMRIFSDFGEAAIAAYAVIDRVTPVAFGVIFALSGSIGPIIGQNVGARLMGRVRRALTDAFILSIGYVLVAWMVLALAAPLLIAAFEARGESADYIAFYCRWGVSAWVFLACLFVANAAFNNLGFPVLAMMFNWVRATLGTIPFVTVGARFWGVKGGLVGFALGAAVFGVMAVATAYFVTGRLAKGFGGRGRPGAPRAAAIGSGA